MRITLEGEEEIFAKIERMKQLTNELSDLAWKLKPIFQVEYKPKNQDDEKMTKE